MRYYLQYSNVFDEDRHKEKKILIALGKKIKEIRLRKKISQTEIAYRCGFDKSNYNTIEAGKRNPTITSLIKIANALETSIVEFFTF